MSHNFQIQLPEVLSELSAGLEITRNCSLLN